jgi:putative ABC transport system ATP-binding protein
MSPPLIEAIGLRKVYREGPTTVHAVRGVSLRVAAARLVLMMGPSGSGKTSLLSMLGCILRPTSGELKIMGRPIVWDEAVLPGVRQKYLGFVFQQFNLLSSLTAAENVAITLRLKGQARGAISRAKAALSAVGLGHRWNFFPRDLSGGEKQRVAIARALIGNPSIVLADEPTGNLDSASGRVVIKLLKQVAVEQQRAVIVVTHDPRIVPFADEVLALEDGVVVSRRVTALSHDADSRVSERRTPTQPVPPAYTEGLVS